MKLFFVVLWCFQSIQGSAQIVDSTNNQKQSLLPERDGLVFFEEIYTTDTSVKKNELFESAKYWLARNINDSKASIDLFDFDSGKIIGRFSFTFKYRYIMAYTETSSQKFEMTVKDGKYRIQIYNIEWSKDNFEDVYRRAKKWGKEWTSSPIQRN